MKKVLVLGGTGAIGTYLVEKLADRSYDVTVISLEDATSSRPNLHFRKANALDKTVVTTLLAEHFDGVIDLMIYWAPPFSDFADLYLQNTAHYIYLSSYRVFADEEHPVVESSPQLLDTAQDPVYLASNDYSLHKARGERFLRASRYKNWTIVRPAITYSKKRCQLIEEAKPDLVISIHQNSYHEEAIRGGQVFYYKTSVRGKKLAESLQKRFDYVLGDSNKRQAKANDNYYLLLHVKEPIVIAECGFLSNREEAKKLETEEYQDRLAWTLHMGIMEYLNQNQ